MLLIGLLRQALAGLDVSTVKWVLRERKTRWLALAGSRLGLMSIVMTDDELPLTDAPAAVLPLPLDHLDPVLDEISQHAVRGECAKVCDGFLQFVQGCTISKIFLGNQ